MSTLRRLLARRGAAAGIAFLVILLTISLCGGLLPVDPFSQDLVASLSGPSSEHWFGTDELGRDILARVIYGARTSLLTAAGAVSIAAILGVPVGLVAGFSAAGATRYS